MSDDSVNSILENISNNPISGSQSFLSDDDDIPESVSLSLSDKKRIMERWLNGDKSKDIAASYGLTTRGVNSIISNNESTRLDMEKRYFAVAAARENRRISETKNKLLDFIDNSIDTALSDDVMNIRPDLKLKFLNNVAMIFDKVDNAGRLNANRPTSVTQHNDIKFDVAEVMKQINTPEDKLKFLQGQLTKIKQNGEQVGETK